ncbi:kazal-type proteinase inhibitor 1 (macronuclear) [Tetrahymena thermophila SB210]|uniref:Kazal-type proteinase inhibitor 1 n=1 Tax=Tetrahymena thermophila (strain SB210) TaxID=312017 RepID=Q24HT3_TETTS|nr:kazal-type proteinase inhibitor 1 [Tetrahymena thermophila SB210]EAS07354.1 kazal-type proteinase inhibitor 1 [Tetrahymena thermophila SB210]|eukprot:XP_001027596.1 kazal-type proteinase inhibitor 1 [Tetrahymena thermophila SB210]
MNKLLLIAALFCLATAQTVQECPTDGSVLECVIQDSPVCGIRSLTNGKQIKETFANYCAACNVGKVEYTVSGKCESYPAQAQFCSPAQSNAEICTMIYDPQCGYFNQQVNCLVPPCNIDQYNRCKTCSTQNVLYTIKGKCPSH